jgi:hypothetical protein
MRGVLPRYVYQYIYIYTYGKEKGNRPMEGEGIEMREDGWMDGCVCGLGGVEGLKGGVYI